MSFLMNCCTDDTVMPYVVPNIVEKPIKENPITDQRAIDFPIPLPDALVKIIAGYYSKGDPLFREMMVTVQNIDPLTINFFKIIFEGESRLELKHSHITPKGLDKALLSIQIDNTFLSPARILNHEQVLRMQGFHFMETLRITDCTKIQQLKTLSTLTEKMRNLTIFVVKGAYPRINDPDDAMGTADLLEKTRALSRINC